MNEQLKKELDWCIAEGHSGPRTHKALIAARAALSSAEEQPVEWDAFYRNGRLMFKIGVQSFTLDYTPEDEPEMSAGQQAEWMLTQLRNALSNLSAPQSSQPIVQPVEKEQIVELAKKAGLWSERAGVGCAFGGEQQLVEFALLLRAAPKSSTEAQPIRWLVEWTESFGEEQSIVYESAEKAEGFVKFNGSGKVTPLYAAPQSSQPIGQPVSADYWKAAAEALKAEVQRLHNERPTAAPDAERDRWQKLDFDFNDKDRARTFHVDAYDAGFSCGLLSASGQAGQSEKAVITACLRACNSVDPQYNPDRANAITECMAAIRALASTPAQQTAAPVNVPSVAEMVNRFLGWPLPKDFAPDCGISFDGRKDDEWNKNKTWPVGTNLFSADQAKAMFEYVLTSASVPVQKLSKQEFLANARRAQAERAAKVYRNPWEELRKAIPPEVDAAFDDAVGIASAPAPVQTEASEKDAEINSIWTAMPARLNNEPFVKRLYQAAIAKEKAKS